MVNSRKRIQPNTKPNNVKAKRAASASPIVYEQIVEPDPAETQRIYDHLRSLPPGYRFKPSDVEIIRDFLMPKLANRPFPTCLIHPVNLYRFHPATLAERYLKHPDGDEVYYFTPRNRKYRNGSRPSRGVEGFGYWKASGADVKIMDGDVHIGLKKTLSFLEGKAPTRTKTNWIMYEYKVVDPRERTSDTDMKLDDWVLCIIKESTSKGNKNEEAETNIRDTEADNAPIVANAYYDEEDHGRNTGYCGTSNVEEDHRRYTGYCGTSNDVEAHGRYTGHLGMFYDREGNGRNTGFGTPYHNQFTVYDEAYRLLNAGQCSNDLYQSHQGMVSHSLPSSINPIPTGQENYNVLRGNYPSGDFSNQLSYDPGMGVNGSEMSPVVDLSNFQTFSYL